MYLQPVYTDEDDGYVYNVLTRSESCPNLEMYHPKCSAVVPRKRAYSEHHIQASESNGAVTPIIRSDTDLARIDKRKTFGGANTNVVNTGDVLARVVQALGSIGTYDPVFDVRAQGYTDSPHLTDENLSVRLSGSECQTPPRRPRHRAVSEYRMPDHALIDDPHEWTWNGTNAQIKELRKMRAKMNNNQNDLFRQVVSPTNKMNGSLTINIDDGSSTPRLITPPPTNQSFFSKLNPFKMGPYSRKNSNIDFEPPPEARRYLEATNCGRESRMSLRQQYVNASSRGRPSIFSVNDNPDQELLENTTIADLIRALEVAHIEENTPGSLLFNENSRQPSPLMGRHNKPVRMHHTESRRVSMFPPEYSEFQEHSLNAHPLQIIRPHGNSRRPSIYPADEAHADGNAMRLNKPHNGGRRASMFPADFNEFQKFTENILHDSYVRETIENESRRSSVDIHEHLSSSRRPSIIPIGGGCMVGLKGRKKSTTPTYGSRRASALPSTQEIHDYQVQSSSRRPSIIPIGSGCTLGLKVPTMHGSRRGSTLPSAQDIHDYQVQSSSRRPSIIPIGGACMIGLGGGKQTATDRLFKQLKTSPPDSPRLGPRRFSGRIGKNKASGLGMQARRLSLRPSPLAGEFPTDTNSPFLSERRGSQQPGQGSVRSSKNVLFRPSVLPTFGSKTLKDNEKNTS